MTSGDVSVIVPAHDAEQTIARALRSVDLQTVRPREVVVVDDASTDGTRAVVEGLSLSVPIRVVASPRRGAAAARNAGVAAARGEIIAFLDADDAWYPTKLEEQLPLLVDDVSLVGALVHYVGSDGTILGTNARFHDSAGATDELRRGAAMPVPLTTLLMRRETFERHGGFDESFRRTQDLELAARVVQDGSRLDWPTNRLLSAYSVHGESATATSYREQFLAAELVRARLRRTSTASYEEWQQDPHIGSAARRAAASGEHYRAAAVAKGEGRTGQFLLRAVRAALLDPVGVAKKVRSRTANRDSLSPLEMPRDVQALFGSRVAAASALASNEVGGLRLVEDPESIIQRVLSEFVADPTTTTVLAAHVSSLNSISDPRFVEAFNTADAAYADGISMTLIARAYGHRADKLATTDLAPQILVRLGELLGRTPRIAVLGGQPGVAQEGAMGLVGMAPVEVVMAEHGYHEDWEPVLARLRSHRPDVVLLGLGMPLEAFWLQEHRAELPPSLVITCGGWLRLLAERERRAPAVMQELELEWLWRLVTDPRRTWRRYTFGTVTLLCHAANGLRSRVSLR